MKILTALMIAMSVLMTSSVFAADGDEKKPEQTEKKKREMPEELATLRKELQAKVKAGEMTKEQAKEKFKAAMDEYKKKNPKKKKEAE